MKSKYSIFSEEIESIKTEIKILESNENREKLNILKEFQQVIKNPNLTYEEQNELFKTVIDFITYTRTKKGIELNIVFK